MWVRFRFIEKNGKSYRLVDEVTVKEAKKIYKEQYKDNDNIIKVWLTHFGQWKEYYHSTLKNLKEKQL